MKAQDLIDSWENDDFDWKAYSERLKTENCKQQKTIKKLEEEKEEFERMFEQQKDFKRKFRKLADEKYQENERLKQKVKELEGRVDITNIVLDAYIETNGTPTLTGLKSIKEKLNKNN